MCPSVNRKVREEFRRVGFIIIKIGIQIHTSIDSIFMLDRSRCSSLSKERKESLARL